MYVSFHQTVCSVHEIFDFLYKCFFHYHIKIHLIVKSNFLKSYEHTKKVKENHYRAVHLQASRASTVTGYLWARILKPAINRPIIIPGKWRWIWWPCDFTCDVSPVSSPSSHSPTSPRGSSTVDSPASPWGSSTVVQSIVLGFISPQEEITYRTSTLVELPSC